MKIFAFFALCFLPAVWGRTINLPSRALCQTLADHGLTNLDRHGCGNVQPMVPITPEAKQEVCSALYHGGLSNISSVGCSEEHVFRAVRTDRENGSKTQLRRAVSHSEPKCSSSALCVVAQKGLINGDVGSCLGGGANDVVRRGEKCSKKSCEILQGSALLNLDLLGCL